MNVKTNKILYIPRSDNKEYDNYIYVHDRLMFIIINI